MKSIAPNIPTMAQTWNMVLTLETLAEMRAVFSSIGISGVISGPI